MDTRYYRAWIEGDPQSDYGVSFPDFMGCASGGGTFEKALRNAEHALALHVQGMIQDGNPLPEPSEPYDPLPDWLIESTGVIAMIKVEFPVE